jgi:hypothetical protein
LTDLEQVSWLNNAGFISTLTAAADTRTKRELAFLLAVHAVVLPRNSRKMTAGMGPLFSLRMTGDKKLSVCKSAGSVAS